MSQVFNVKTDSVIASVENLVNQNKQLEKQINDMVKAQASDSVNDLDELVTEKQGIHYLSHVLEESDLDIMRDAIDGFKSKYDKGLVILANVIDEKVQVLVGVSKALTVDVKAGNVIKHILQQIGGRGGGRPDFAQGGGEATVTEIKTAIEQSLTSIESNMSN